MCELCNNVVKEVNEYGPNKCVGCGARHFDHDEFVELRDVIVQIRQVGEQVDDHREPAFDTEKEVVVHTRDDDTSIINNDVHRPVDSFEFRGQDEIGFMGLFFHGDMHGEAVSEAKKVRIGTDIYEITDDMDARSVEVQNGGDFRNHTDRRY